MFTAYPPLEAHPLFYLAILVFAVGVLIAVGIFFANVVGAKRDGPTRGPCHWSPTAWRSRRSSRCTRSAPARSPTA
jgi:hypothetical protein